MESLSPFVVESWRPRLLQRVLFFSILLLGYITLDYSMGLDQIWVL